MFLEHLGTQYEITSIFKPNEPFANVAEDLRELGNDFTKRHHIIIVGGHATSHITRLYIRIKFLPSKIYRREGSRNLCSRKINTSHDCKEKDFKICAIKLQTKSSKLIILSSYRVPTGNFNEFIKSLDNAVKHQFKPTVEFLICGDINTDYLTESNRKKSTSLIIDNIQSVVHSKFCSKNSKQLKNYN